MSLYVTIIEKAALPIVTYVIGWFIRGKLVRKDFVLKDKHNAIIAARTVKNSIRASLFQYISEWREEVNDANIMLQDAINRFDDKVAEPLINLRTFTNGHLLFLDRHINPDPRYETIRLTAFGKEVGEEEYINILDSLVKEVEKKFS